MKYEIKGKQKTVIREYKGEQQIILGMFKLWFSRCGVSILTEGNCLLPTAWNTDYIYRNRNIKDCIRDVIERSILQIEVFNKEKAMAELQEALTRINEIVELYEQGEANDQL